MGTDSKSVIITSSSSELGNVIKSLRVGDLTDIATILAELLSIEDGRPAEEIYKEQEKRSMDMCVEKIFSEFKGTRTPKEAMKKIIVMCTIAAHTAATAYANACEVSHGLALHVTGFDVLEAFMATKTTPPRDDGGVGEDL